MRSPAIISELKEHFRKPVIFNTAKEVTPEERLLMHTLKSSLKDVDPLDNSIEIISTFRFIETETEVTIRETSEIRVKRMS